METSQQSTVPTEAAQERPLVTFALFAYNQERFIREAVEGALAQTYSPLEIILSDDCSTDGTYQLICDAIGAYTGPHHVIARRTQRNLGLIGHVTEVFAAARGQLIVLAAGDDVSQANRTECIVERWLAAGKPSAVCSDLQYMNAEGQIAGRYLCARRTVPPSRSERIHQYVMHRRFGVHGATGAWTPELVRDFPEMLPGAAEDDTLAVRALLRDGIAFIPEPLVKYRIHDCNLSAGPGGPGKINLPLETRRERMRIVNWRQHAADLEHAAKQGVLQEVEAKRLIAWCSASAALHEFSLHALTDPAMGNVLLNRMRRHLQHRKLRTAAGAWRAVQRRVAAIRASIRDALKVVWATGCR